MRKLWAVITALLVPLFPGCNREKTPDRVPLDVQMREFAQIGIKLNPGITMDEVIDLWPVESLESNPYTYLYSALGGERELDPDAHFSDQVWDFDTETLCEGIEYKELLQNIGRISCGELKYDNIKVTYLDDELNPVVKITFDLNGTPSKWTIHPYIDWNGAAFLSPINEYARSHGLKGRLVWNRSWGTDWTLGWHTPEQIAALRALGLDIAEITPEIRSRPYPSHP